MYITHAHITKQTIFYMTYNIFVSPVLFSVLHVTLLLCFLKKKYNGSVGWASSAKQKVAGLTPGQGTCPGCRFCPRSGCVRVAFLMFLSHINVSLSLPPSCPLSLKINKILKKINTIKCSRVNALLDYTCLAI